MTPIATVELNSHEKAIYDAIPWAGNDWLGWDWEERQSILVALQTLTLSLLKRKAIPQVRWDWFSKPEMNIGGGGKSRKQVFEGNGTKGDAIYGHGNFIPYLWYFIHGPRLPGETIAGFCRTLDSGGTAGMVRDQIREFVRKEVRERVGPNSHDEFAKLAFEVDRADLAESVRDAAKDAGRQR